MIGRNAEDRIGRVVATPELTPEVGQRTGTGYLLQNGEHLWIQSVGTSAAGMAQQPVPDLNGISPVSMSGAISISLDEASIVFPPQLFISTRGDEVRIRSSCSTPSISPRTLARTPSGTSNHFTGPVPEHLASAIHEWL
jgi:hypothetical protein